MKRALVAVVPLLGAALALPSSGAGAPPGGCRGGDAERVVSFTTTGHVTGSRAAACTQRTGFLTSESHVRVLPDGTVVQQPAQTAPGAAGTGFVSGAPGPKPQTQLTPAGFAVAGPGGGRWQRVLPGGLEWVASDGAIHVDRATGRLYYYALSPAWVPQAGGVAATDQVPAGYAHLLSSPDGGRTWTHTQAPGYVESENPRFASGPTPRGGDRPVPGERVAYWCGNTALFVYGQRDCWRTLDGGSTWQYRSTLLRRGQAVHAECGSDQEQFDAGDGSYPEAGPDGSLWVLVRCGTSTFLARSTDEAASFPVVRKVPAFDELRVDARGRMYAVHLDGTKLLLRTSRDQGRTWSAPVDLVAPGLRGRAVGQWAMALSDAGQVAVAYLTAHPGGGYDGSVTRTTPLARTPVLEAVTVHGGRRVLVTAPQSAKDDYIDLDLGPDGDVWAAFYGDCGNEPVCATSPQNPMAKISVMEHLLSPRVP